MSRRLRVLLAIASAGECSELTEILLRGGIAVLHAKATWDAAIDAADSLVDAAIVAATSSDLGLIEWVRRARALRDDLPIFAVVQHGRTNLVEDLVDAGVRACIAQDRLEEIPGLVRETVAESRRDGSSATPTRSRLLAALEESVQGVALVNHEGRVFYRNPAAAAMVGEPGGVLGRQVLAGVHPSQVDEVRRAFAALTAQPNGRMRITVRYRSEGSSSRDLDVVAVNMLDRRDVQALVLQFRDVTAELEAKAALRFTETRFESIFNSITEGVFLADREGRLLACNAAFLSSYRVPADPPSIVEVFVDPASWSQCAEEVLADGAEHRVETLLWARDGSQRWVEICGRRFGDERDEGVCLGTVRDITAERNARIALEQSEHRWRQLLSASPDGIIVHRSGRIAWLNQAACALFGISKPEEVLGRDQLDFVPPEYHDTIRKRRAELEHGAEVVARLEQEFVRADGTRVPVETVAARFTDAGGPAVLLIVRDIRARREQAQRVARLTRIRGMLSSSSAMVLRARSRETLLHEVCRVAVEEGGFVQGWIGFQDSADGGLIILSGCKSDGGEIDVESATQRRLMGLAVRALAERRNLVQQGEPAVGAASSKAPPGSQESMAAIPFGEGSSRGVLALLADRPDAFDAEELGLLSQIGAELAFALEGLARDAQLDFIAYHDPLTGLANRELLLDRLAQLCASCPEDHVLAVMHVDVQRFRAINDYLGREGGDQLLRSLAARLTQAFPAHATVGRVGSNAFVVACTGFANPEEVAHALEQVRFDKLEREFDIGGRRLNVTTRMGVALFPHDGGHGEELLRNAEAAWVTAVQRQEPYAFYAAETNVRVTELLTLEHALQRAIENEEFVVHYQPRVGLTTGEVTGVEALLRWNDPERGLVLPGPIIGILEEAGLIHRVGRWLLQKVVADWRRWRAHGWLAPRIGVNVSTVQLRRADFVDEVKAAIGAPGVDQPTIDMEITESVFLENLPGAISTLNELRALGIQIAIDDFGTGYSSLSYLARLPVDVVKVDKSFTAAIGREKNGTAIVATVVHLAAAMGLRSVAEGVETYDQVEQLRLLRCDEIQGFLISRALPVAELEEILQDRARRAALAAPSRRQAERGA